MAATEPHVGQHVRSQLATRDSIIQGEVKMKYSRLIMLILVAVAVGLMISTYVSLSAYAAKSRHISLHSALCSVTRRKQERPGNASNDNTAHMPTARISADLTKPNHTPTRHTLTKDK